MSIHPDLTGLYIQYLWSCASLFVFLQETGAFLRQSPQRWEMSQPKFVLHMTDDEWMFIWWIQNVCWLLPLCSSALLLLCCSSTLHHCRNCLSVQHPPAFIYSLPIYFHVFFSFASLFKPLRSAEKSSRSSVICRFHLIAIWKLSWEYKDNSQLPLSQHAARSHQLMEKRTWACPMRRQADCLIFKHLIVHQSQQNKLCKILCDVPAVLTAVSLKVKSPN